MPNYEEVIKDIINNPLYLFSWDDIPKNNTELMNFLKDGLKVNWVKGATIKKSDNKKIIIVMNRGKFLIFKLNELEEKVTLETADGKTYEYLLKQEGGRLKVYNSYIWIKEQYGMLYIVFPTTEKKSRKVTCEQFEDKKVISIKGEYNNCQSCYYHYCQVNNRFLCPEVPPDHLPHIDDCVLLTYHLNHKGRGYVKLRYYAKNKRLDRRLFMFVRKPQECGNNSHDLEVYKDIEFKVTSEQGKTKIANPGIWSTPEIKMFISVCLNNSISTT